jgi:hypothetical protein
MNLYFLIYYRIYKATHKTNNDVVEWTSMVALSALVFFNILTLLALVYPNISKIGLKKFHFIAGSICIMSINYFIFIYRKKYIHIFKEYSIIKWINSFPVGFLVILYIVGSIYLMMHILDGLPK